MIAATQVFTGGINRFVHQWWKLLGLAGMLIALLLGGLIWREGIAGAKRNPDGGNAHAPADNALEPAVPGRYVIQVGSYTEVGPMREARLRVERLGFLTYTNFVETSAGRRTRVRVGPFSSKVEAETVATQLKAAGMLASVLAL